MYDKAVTVHVPADALGQSMPEDLIAKVVESALSAAPSPNWVDINHAFTSLSYDRLHGKDQYEAACQLAGVIMRYAWIQKTKEGK